MGQPKVSFGGHFQQWWGEDRLSRPVLSRTAHSQIVHSDIRTRVSKTLRVINIRPCATDDILNTLCCLLALKLSIYIRIDANSFYLFITSWHLYLEQISEITWSETVFSIKMLLYLLTVMTYYAVFLWYCRHLFYIYNISWLYFSAWTSFMRHISLIFSFSFYPFRCGITCVYVYANFCCVFIWWCHKMYNLLLMPEFNAWNICLLQLFFIDNVSGQLWTPSSTTIKGDKDEF